MLFGVMGIRGKHFVNPRWEDPRSRLLEQQILVRERCSRWAEAYGKLPLSFEEKRGQTAQEVRFVSHGAGYELFLTPQEAVLRPAYPRFTLICRPGIASATARALRNASRARTMTAVRMRLKEQILPRRSADGRAAQENELLYRQRSPKVARRRTLLWTREVCRHLSRSGRGLLRESATTGIRLRRCAGADPKAIRLDRGRRPKLRVSARGDVVWAFRRRSTAPKAGCISDRERGTARDRGTLRPCEEP